MKASHWEVIEDKFFIFSMALAVVLTVLFVVYTTYSLVSTPVIPEEPPAIVQETDLYSETSPMSKQIEQQNLMPEYKEL